MSKNLKFIKRQMTKLLHVVIIFFVGVEVNIVIVIIIVNGP